MKKLFLVIFLVPFLVFGGSQIGGVSISGNGTLYSTGIVRLNQSLETTDSPIFSGLTISGTNIFSLFAPINSGVTSLVGTDGITLSSPTGNIVVGVTAIAWSKISGAPTIPTDNSQLSNGAGYISSVDSVPYDAGPIFSAPLSRSNGILQSGTTLVSGTLYAPTGGSVGKQLEIWLTVAGNSNQTISIDSSIKLPSDSGLTLPKTLTAGKLYIIKLWHNGTNWMLVSLVGGY